MPDWIEYAKLATSIATPIVVAGFGYILSKRLKSIDDAQWQSRKVVEKRLDLYDKIAPNLNLMFCFSMWVGYWKDISPTKMIEAKRELDKTVNIYRHLLSEEFYEKYNEFIHLLFETYTGAGKDALIRGVISGPDGDRRSHSNYAWEKPYDELFASGDHPARKEIVNHYNEVMLQLRRCIGLNG